MENRYAPTPHAVKSYDTEQLRKEFLIEQLFVADQLVLVYSHVDRMITGGALPVNKSVKLEASAKDMGAEFFLERREIGIFNVGGKGSITVDGEKYELNTKDCLYIGLGNKEVLFASDDAKNPARFYLNSAPAHMNYPTKKMSFDEANANHLGAPASSNERVLRKYIHQGEGGIQSCQLVMGMTALKENNMWNSWPCHTHNRRMEVYFYFELAEDANVFHFMGEPTETRHIVTRNEQAIISPSWSIHTGVGTSNYTFIWGMAGENQVFDDMDPVSPKEIL